MSASSLHRVVFPRQWKRVLEERAVLGSDPRHFQLGSIVSAAGFTPTLQCWLQIHNL